MYTIDYDKLEEFTYDKIRQLSCYGDIYILVKDMSAEQMKRTCDDLLSKRIRRPAITDRVVGEYVRTKEDLECILSSI